MTIARVARLRRQSEWTRPLSVLGNAADHRTPAAPLIEPVKPPETAQGSQQNPLVVPEGSRHAEGDPATGTEKAAQIVSEQIQAPVNNGDKTPTQDPHRAPPGEIASITAAPLPAPASDDRSPAASVTVAIGAVSTEPKGTAIAYTITNPAASLVDLLFIRCNAIDPKGAVVGSAFDYVENIPGGQQVKRVVRMPSDVVPQGGTFTCAIDAAAQ